MPEKPTAFLPDMWASRFPVQEDGTYLYKVAPGFSMRLTPLSGPSWILDAVYEDTGQNVFCRSGDSVSRLVADAYLAIEDLRKRYAQVSERMRHIVNAACDDLTNQDPSRA